MHEPAHGPDPQMNLPRTHRHQQHVAGLGIANPHQHPIEQPPIATPQRVPARNFAEITSSPQSQRNQPDTIEPIRPPPMQPKPRPHRRNGSRRDPAQAPGYRVSRSIPGRYGSPRKFTAFPNRPAQVAKLLSHPSTTSTSTPASTTKAGTARNVIATPAPRAIALSNPQFAPPNQRNSPPPNPDGIQERGHDRLSVRRSKHHAQCTRNLAARTAASDRRVPGSWSAWIRTPASAVTRWRYDRPSCRQDAVTAAARRLRRAADRAGRTPSRYCRAAARSANGCPGSAADRGRRRCSRPAGTSSAC